MDQSINFIKAKKIIGCKLLASFFTQKINLFFYQINQSKLAGANMNQSQIKLSISNLNSYKHKQGAYSTVLAGTSYSKQLTNVKKTAKLHQKAA